MYGPPNVTLMSDADEADGARLKTDAAGGVAEDDDGAELAARRLKASGSTGGALLRGKRPSSGDGDLSSSRWKSSVWGCTQLWCRRPMVHSGCNGQVAVSEPPLKSPAQWPQRGYAAIAPASLSGPHTTAEPTVCRVDEWSFLRSWGKTWQ